MAKPSAGIWGRISKENGRLQQPGFHYSFEGFDEDLKRELKVNFNHTAFITLAIERISKENGRETVTNALLKWSFMKFEGRSQKRIEGGLLLINVPNSKIKEPKISKENGRIAHSGGFKLVANAEDLKGELKACLPWKTSVTGRGYPIASGGSQRKIEEGLIPWCEGRIYQWCLGGCSDVN